MAAKKKTDKKKVIKKNIARTKAVKKKAVKKKNATKKDIKKKKRASKPRLGHDPLAWLAEDESDEPAIVESVKQAEEPALQDIAAEKTEAEPASRESVEQAEEEPVAQVAPDKTEDEPVQQEVSEPIDEEAVPVYASDAPADENASVNKGGAIELPSGFGIAQVDDFYERFKSMLDSQDCIQINAGEVGVVDAAALQLLLAVRQQADRDGKTIEWLTVSDKLRTSAAIINVAEQLGLAE